MKSTQIALTMTSAVFIFLTGLIASAQEGDHEKMHAAMEECAKASGIKIGTAPTDAQHEAMHKCLEGKGMHPPKLDPAREAAFKDCMKTANIKEGEKPQKGQFEAVHKCMEDKGFKGPGHGMHGEAHMHKMNDTAPAAAGAPAATTPPKGNSL